MPLPEGLRQYSKGTPIKDSEFDVVRRSLGVGDAGRQKRKESGRMWRVSIEEIRARNYNLDFKNPNGPAAAEYKTLKVLLEQIKKTEKDVTKLLDELQSEV